MLHRIYTNFTMALSNIVAAIAVYVASVGPVYWIASRIPATNTMTGVQTLHLNAIPMSTIRRPHPVHVRSKSSSLFENRFGRAHQPRRQPRAAPPHPPPEIPTGDVRHAQLREMLFVQSGCPQIGN